MTDTSEENNDFSEMSDQEIRELSEELTEAVPEAMGKTLGVDVFGQFEDNDQEEFEEEFPGQIEALLIGFRDALSKESEEEQAVAMFEVYNEMTKQFMMGSEDREEFESGFNFIIEQLRVTLKGSREGMKELGYVDCFDLMDEFAMDIVESGQSGEVKKFFDGLEGNSQQMVLQRMMNPVVTQYYEYLEEHQEITDADEAREYADMYYELAELVANILPQFLAAIQIVSDRKEAYDELKQMGLNNLLQKLESKKYGRFNELAEGIDRELRNSIAHRDFKIEPIEHRIEFHDRDRLVSKLTYSEFQDEVIHLLALFNALWVFRLILTYHRIKNLPDAVEKLREENED
jgi:hypothetical protein